MKNSSVLSEFEIDNAKDHFSFLLKNNVEHEKYKNITHGDILFFTENRIPDHYIYINVFMAATVAWLSSTVLISTIYAVFGFVLAVVFTISAATWTVNRFITRNKKPFIAITEDYYIQIGYKDIIQRVDDIATITYDRSGKEFLLRFRDETKTSVNARKSNQRLLSVLQAIGSVNIAEK